MSRQPAYSHEPARLSADDLLAGRHTVDPRILAQLRGRKIAEERCLTCGYPGPQPIERIRRPWWGGVTISVLMILTVILLPLAAILLVFGAINTRYYMRCPNCGTPTSRKRGPGLTINTLPD